MMNRYIILIMSILFLDGVAYSAPSISTASGSLVDGGTLVISGSSIGAKTTAAPLLWDNVESGSASAAWTQLGAGISIYSSTGQLANSAHCFRMDKSLQTTYNMKKTQEITSQLYTFVKRKYAYDMTYDNHKFFRVWQSDVTPGYVKDSVAWNYIDGYDNPKYTMSKGEGNKYDPANPNPIHTILMPLQYWPHVDVWQTDEFFMQLETGIGIYDGILGYRLNNNTRRDWATNRASFDAYHNFPYTDIYVDNFSHNHPLGNGPDYYYVDDVYIDTTWARVMIGDELNFDDCTSLEIQIPIAWNSGTGEISITLNQGAMDSLEGKYLFVIDSTNTPSTGYLLSESSANPIVEILTASGQTTTASVFEITGTATADTGLTIAGVTCPGQTVTSDDGTFDELSESWTCQAVLSVGANNLIFTGTDSIGATGAASIEVMSTAPQTSGSVSTAVMSGCVFQ